MRSCAAQRRHRAPQQFALARLDAFDADAPLQVERERGLQRLQHAGRAGLFALLDVGDEVLVVRAHVIDGAAARDARRQVAAVQPLVEHEHAARARTAEELVRRQEHGVDRRVAAVVVRRRVHVDLDVRRARGEVEAGEGIVGVQQLRDLADRRAHAGDVRGGRERADARAPWYSGACSSCSRCARSMPPSAARLTSTTVASPWRQVTSLLWCSYGPDEHDGLLRLLVTAERFELCRRRGTARRCSPTVLARRRRQRDAQDLLQLVDRAGRAGAAGDDATLRPGVHRALDRALRLVQQPAHAAAGQVVLGVRVGVDALQVLQVALDERRQRPDAV